MDFFILLNYTLFVRSKGGSKVALRNLWFSFGDNSLLPVSYQELVMNLMESEFNVTQLVFHLYRRI